MARRVVVTGMGLVTPFGTNLIQTWQRLNQGHCAITFKDGLLAGRVATDQLPTEILSNKLYSRFIQFAMAATDSALIDSRLAGFEGIDLDRVGVCVGTSTSSLQDTIQELENTASNLNDRKSKKSNLYYIPRILPNMASSHISIKYKLSGPCHTVSNACTTGANSIGDAYRFIKYGDADIIIAGSSDAPLTTLAINGFSRLRALAPNNPAKTTTTSTPFDKDRHGFVIAEGCGIIILEALETAVGRNARIYGEIVGYGMASDAYHITTPPLEAIGAQKCMKNALNDAKINPSQIGYINCHATSTPVGDRAEAKAIQKVFGNVNVSSTKGAIGHLMAAAASVEAIFTMMAIHTNILPPNLNLNELEPGMELDYVLNSKKVNLEYAMTNSFGFGGSNCSLIFRQYNP